MTQQYIKLLINFACQQLKKRIINSAIPNRSYLNLLQEFPEKMKEQAEKSLEALEQVDAENLLTAIVVKNDYLQSIDKLNAAFQKCNQIERIKITQAQLAPFQVDQFARQLIMIPGIILAYEHITRQKR